MFTRKLGKSNIQVSALGLGCWAIGGPMTQAGQPEGWGKIDDRESVRAIHRALDLGITFFDTADCYGCGHSEQVLGRALQGRRDRVVVATKFGETFDEEKKELVATCADPDYIRRACDASLKRLRFDYIDLYQFHLGDYPLHQAPAVRDVLEELVAAGKVRWYGWSTDSPERAALFAPGRHCCAIQQCLNIFDGNLATLALCERNNVASINRTALGMGVLTGKYTKESRLPSDDIRSRWGFTQGHAAQQLDKLEKVKSILTADGRSLVQGALGWIWAKSPVTIPIPGFKTVQQVEENCAAADFGPLNQEQMENIKNLIGG